MKELLKSSNEVTRREMMATAARACLGVGVMAGPGASLLMAGGQTAATGKAKHLIYLYMAGGMSHIDTFDPKSDSDTGGPFKAIDTSAPGVKISEHLSLTAKQMDKVALVRSMTSKQGAHDRGNYMMHTSYAPLGTIRHPAMGAWALRLAGRINQTLPGNVVVNGRGRHPGAGFLGSQFEPLFIGKPDAGLQNVALPRGTSEEQFERRNALLQRLDKGFRARYPQESVQAYNRFYDEAKNLMHSEDLKAFDLSSESASVKELYGSDSFGQGCLLARRLVQHGVRSIEVTTGGWDTHQDNFTRLGDRLLPGLDRGLSALLADLGALGLLDETLVVLTSEFGRTPKINQRTGRDHYPRVFTTLLAGGGVKGGQVFGKSDEKGAAAADSPVQIGDFNATIGYAMGIDPAKPFISPIGRPFNMANGGKPLTSLF